MDKENLAYIIGIAIGDGNLSNPNGRATRLRITCDIKYKNLIKNIISSIRKILPKNKISLVKRVDNCVDISCYSNKWEVLLGWTAKDGPKHKQRVSIPEWIKKDKKFILPCLKGLFETDGSIYFDRKYKMVNFTTVIPNLANDVVEIIRKTGFNPNMQINERKNGKTKYTVRISKNTEDFLKTVKIDKS